MNLITFNVIKNVAIVVRISDLLLNSCLRELAIKGPPMPNKPCETPPIRSMKVCKILGNFTLSKKITLAERIIESAPKIVNIVCELILVKIRTPIIVPRRHTGRLWRKTFLENDL